MGSAGKGERTWRSIERTRCRGKVMGCRGGEAYCSGTVGDLDPPQGCPTARWSIGAGTGTRSLVGVGDASTAYLARGISPFGVFSTGWEGSRAPRRDLIIGRVPGYPRW